MDQIHKRVANIFKSYDDQGVHRTGTDGDAKNARWLAENIQSLGLNPVLSAISLNRIDPLQASIRIDDRACDGIPLFDCTYTDSKGISGPLGPPGSKASIAVEELPPNWRLTEARSFMKLRRQNTHKAMIIVCGGPRFGMPPGIALLNAEYFNEPFGPPVLQVPSTAGSWLLKTAASGAEGRLVAQIRRTAVTAFNVETRVKGINETLAPVVVMTPRSGWFNCVSERGGGIACWLEIMRAVRAEKLKRDVVFIATTGHELGHHGLKHFIHNNPKLLKHAYVWIHLGANFAAAKHATIWFQASDTGMEAQGLRAMKQMGIVPDHLRPTGARPFGEAHNIFDGGGRYISLLGENALFHHPEDRWPHAVDLDKAIRIIAAFTGLVVNLAKS
ncbi:MAG: M28 family peptidase [Deltaproteobacteria bacterium]|nr:M28 family peptidase [Deltaproteobacteria bacterium]MBW1963537.1 M28 family peptidase [Deltaproteobacteria bacterium]MBW2154301.1 M28 family peptidase [Deltaproteobacteria bacterium]